MSDIFREVDEDLRHDRAMAFWKKYANTLIAGAIAIVAAVGGWRVYDSYQQRERAALGAAYDAAIAQIAADKPDSAAALTALAEKKAGTYSGLAKFRLASELARKAQDEAGRKDAAGAFDAIGNDAALPQAWRDLAKLRAAMVLVDTAPLNELEARLTPMMASGQTYRHSARESVALAAYRQGESDKALSILEQIILDTETPGGLRQRAEMLLAIVRSGPKPKS